MERNLKGRVADIRLNKGDIEVWVSVGGKEEQWTVKDMFPPETPIQWRKGTIDVGDFLPPEDDEIWREIPCVVFMHKGEVIRVMT